MMYAFSENFVLPISHDEVVHGKKSLLNKVNGSIEDKFATTRTFMLYMMSHPGKKLSFMGNEFGQFKEWAYKEGLEFFMLKFDLHKKLQALNKRLNLIYKSNSPLYELEDSWDGFEWVSVDERQNNIIAYNRIDRKGNKILAIFNFSGNDYFGYRLGCDKGEYKLLIASDEKKYGGTGVLERKQYKSAKKTAHNKEYSIKINLPKLSGAYFIKL